MTRQTDTTQADMGQGDMGQADRGQTDTPQTGPSETRRPEILDSIKQMFAQKGFDGASMKDLAQAAGMSAGNFYRYFPSKSAIIEAMIERDLDRVRADFTFIMQSGDPRGALRDLVRQRIETIHADDGPVWAEIEAAAARRPEVAALMQRMADEVTHNLVAVFARIAAVDPAEADRRFSAHARLIVMLVQGITMKSCSVSDDPGSGMRGPVHDLALEDLVIEVIDRTLSDIAGFSAPANLD